MPFFHKVELTAFILVTSNLYLVLPMIAFGACLLTISKCCWGDTWDIGTLFCGVGISGGCLAGLFKCLIYFSPRMPIPRVA